MHSCQEMTLFVNESDPRNAVVAPAPRNALSLRRLFPPTCPVSTAIRPAQDTP